MLCLFGQSVGEPHPGQAIGIGHHHKPEQNVAQREAPADQDPKHDPEFNDEIGRGDQEGWNTILSDARRPLILLGFAAAIPVILFAGWVAYLTAAEERATARRTAYEAVERVTERVAAELSKQLQAVETLATSCHSTSRT